MNDKVKTEQPNEAHISPSELNDGLAAAEEILNDLLDQMHPPEMRRDNQWHLVPTVNVKVELLKKLQEIIRTANVIAQGREHSERPAGAEG